MKRHRNRESVFLKLSNVLSDRKISLRTKRSAEMLCPVFSHIAVNAGQFCFR